MFKKYDIVNISGLDGYRCAWIDCDNAMLLACFKLLNDFVEKEDPRVGLRTLEDYGYHSSCLNEPCEKCKEHNDIQFIAAQIERDKKVRELYNWWNKERNEEDWIKQHDVDTEKLIELMKIRGCLWT